MKKTFTLCLIVLAAASASFGQLNMSLLSHVQYPVDGNDIWGWVAPDGTEYAIMGLRNGVSIVSLADPTNAQEVAFIPGQNSTWRDIKTWDGFAYVTTDQPGTTNGLTVIDLRDLPNSADYFHWTPDLPGLGTLNTCHNIYIDEFGYAYLAGCNLNGGGMLYIDVFSEPGNPIFVGPAPSNYAHDVYVRDNKMYASEIYAGEMAIYDVSDKGNTIELGRQRTPFSFTHNIWLSDDGNVAYTTDERANAPIGAYDVSDPDNIVELDQFRPLATLGANVIPHNVHVWNDWLIISYYTDGGIVVDASRPDNLIEVGNFDTFFGGNGGFSGAWGAYPFLPSGNVLISDINSGLYVLGVNYVRACWLEGNVRNANTAALLDGVKVAIATSEPNQASTDLSGKYRTGLAIPGSYEVTFTKVGYQPLTVSVDLANGVLTELDVELIPLPAYSISGLVLESGSNVPVPGAQVVFGGEEISFTATADANGVFNFSAVFADNYAVTAGAWGYLHRSLDLLVDDNNTLTLLLDRGYQDDFVLDLDWATEADPTVTNGFWDRGEPVGTYSGNQQVQPEFDVNFDLGNACYVTGNGGGGIGAFDLDGGSVRLISPPMDLSIYQNPVVSYNLWFHNSSGNSPLNDDLRVSLTNGIDTILLELVAQSGAAWRPRSSFIVADYLDFTAGPVTIIFEATDNDPGHVVEAAVDAFLVEGDLISSVDSPLAQVEMGVSPNPFSQQFVLNYQIDRPYHTAQARILNALGQTVDTQILGAATGQLNLGASLQPGFYVLQLVIDGQPAGSAKVVKN